MNDDKTATDPQDDQDENVKPLQAGDDFSDGVNSQDDLNPETTPLDSDVEASYADDDDKTLPSDEATDDPYSTESGLEEVDEKVIPEEKNNLGDEVYNPLEDDEDDEE